MPVVAVTGDICSGKSTVLRILKEKGARTVSLDKWVHNYYRDRESIVYKKIKNSFPAVFNRKGDILRKKLGRIVFSNPRLLRRLEAIVHPFVVEDLKKWVLRNRNRREVFIVEIPLLFEKNLEGMFDRVILVSAHRPNIIKRAEEKLGISELEAKRRLSCFIPVERKRNKADFVIENNCSLFELKKKVGAIWRKIKKGE